MRTRLAAILAVLLCAATACGTEPDPTGDPDGGRTQDGLTAPGSTLAVGETATLTTDGGAVVEVTVTRIDTGSAADLRQVGYEDADQDVPSYVSYELRVVSGDVQGLTMRHYLSAWSGDSPASELVVSEQFPPCQETNLPSGAGAGATVASCRPYLTDRAAAAPVDRVQFANQDEYDAAADRAVWWEQ